MKNKNSFSRRALSLLLSVLMMVSVISVGAIQASAYTSPGNVNTSSVESKISDLYNKLGQNGAYFNCDRSTGCGSKSSGHGCNNCNIVNILQQNWFKNMFGNIELGQLPPNNGCDGSLVNYNAWSQSCQGFARFAEWYLFKTSNTDRVTIHNVAANQSFSKATFDSYAKPGDMIAMGTYSNATHWAIYCSHESDGIWVIDCNSQGSYNCQIYIRKYAYGSFGYSHVGIARADNSVPTPVGTVTIDDVKVSNISSSGYTVDCYIHKDSGVSINRVQFPTWSNYNGQDDLISDWTTNSKVRGTYTGQAVVSGRTTDVYRFRVNISDHNYDTGYYITHIYVWTTSSSEAQVCKEIGVTVHNHSYSWVTDKSATCTDSGTKHEECSICGDKTNTGTTIPALGHSWNSWYVSTPATCTSSGVETRTCSRNSSHKETRTVSALGHSWGTPTYTWSTDNKTCTATRVCTRDSSHKETETVNAVSSTVASAGCESSGSVKYTATFSNSAFTTQTKTVTVSSTGHSWGTPTYKWSSDNKTCTATRVCANDSSHKETETVNAVTTTVTSAGCESSGKVKYTATFSNSAFTTQTKTVTVSSTGHSWGTPTYKWSSDNKTCTATRTCTNDSSHKETETVNAVSTTVSSAGCESSGKVKYTATFSNTAFTTQTKTVTVPSTGHSWGTPTYKWSTDNKTCTATRVCANDSSHKETETVNTTSQVIKQPTTTETGTRKFTATFTNSAFTTQTKNVSIPKLDEPVDDDIYFPDVSKKSWYYDAVQYCAKKGYISGYENGFFGPGDNLKRQDFVVILANIANVNLSKYQGKSSILTDVNKNAYYAAAVNWAVNEGIISGYQNGKFGVNDPITREQVATILYRYMGEPSVSNANSILSRFSDSGRISSFAKTPVAWAVKNEIISGMADGRVAPTEGASRAQIASIIMRMDQKGMF